MWGEIEPSFRPQSPETFENSQPLRNDQEEEEEDEDEGDNMMQSAHVVCAQSTALKGPGEVSCGLSAMIEAIAFSGSPVKSQQLGEPDLSVEEKKKVLLEQYEAKPLVFLERYHAHIKPEHLEAFSHLSSDCRAQYYCTEVQKRASCSSNRTRVRNHRYAALRALQKEGQYFSEEQMRFREPLLYEQYIGQYLSDDEILQRSEEAMQQGPACLSDLLINSYQEKQLQNRLQEEQDREQCAEEEEEDDEEEEENNASRQAEWEPSAEEKAMLREEFLSQMHQRFLDGKDRDFNYSEVDENPDYDNLDILNRDAEERYFDEDDGNEEEEEEDDEDKENKMD